MTDHATPSRRRVLELLQDSPSPLTVDDVARATGLHANTVRAHLQLLVDMGQVERDAEQPTQPGRPRILYRPRITATAINPYRLLATELAAGIVASGDGDEAAGRAAGRHWAKTLRDRAGADEEITADAAIGLVNEGLSELGFATETEPLGDRLYLRSCPFVELARHNRGVCQLHEDLLTGCFEELAVDVQVASLDVFVRPDLCVAHLRRTDLAHSTGEPT
jgi:predicted ArsR family transcriptional regulator